MIHFETDGVEVLALNGKIKIEARSYQGTENLRTQVLQSLLLTRKKNRIAYQPSMLRHKIRVKKWLQLFPSKIGPTLSAPHVLGAGLQAIYRLKT